MAHENLAETRDFSHGLRGRIVSVPRQATRQISASDRKAGPGMPTRRLSSRTAQSTFARLRIASFGGILGMLRRDFAGLPSVARSLFQRAKEVTPTGMRPRSRGSSTTCPDLRRYRHFGELPSEQGPFIRVNPKSSIENNRADMKKALAFLVLLAILGAAGAWIWSGVSQRRSSPSTAPRPWWPAASWTSRSTRRGRALGAAGDLRAGRRAQPRWRRCRHRAPS